MKIFKLFILSLLLGPLFIGCSKDNNDVVEKTGQTPPVETPDTRNLEVENFIYRGLNNIYLYKSSVPELADDYFSTQTELNDFLVTFDSPEILFYDGLTAPQDRFSFLVDDYVELENTFSGISTTTGMTYGLVRYCQSCSEVLGYVRYVLPNTSAEANGLQRGDIFTRVDGEQLTDQNYGMLLAKNTFTLGLATLDGNTITDKEETITLTKAEYNTNPVYIAKTLDVEGIKVGYLMYNSFTADYDPQLNDAFGQFKADGVTELILDLRYDGGGSVRTATDLASMITGQFTGEVFMKEQWNADYQAYYEQNNPENLINRFHSTLKTGEMINSLNLSRVYVLTTLRTASASELVINGLKPYIDVVQVGETTTGKFQASVTLYDSPNFDRANANPDHTYAIQPLVLKSVNANGVSDYVNGLMPNIEVTEDIGNLGKLGDSNEPFLNAAINDILGTRKMIDNNFPKFDFVGETGEKALDYQRMYIDELPAIKTEQ